MLSLAPELPRANAGTDVLLSFLKGSATCPPAGISQSYISQWLLQQGLEMSDSKRRAFYRWYLLERNNPGETRRDAIFQVAGAGLEMLSGRACFSFLSGC